MLLMKNIKQAFIAPLTLTYAINQTLIENNGIFQRKEVLKYKELLSYA